MAVDQSGNKALEISGCTEKSLTEAVCVCGGALCSLEREYINTGGHMALTVEKKVRGTEKRQTARGRGLLLGTRPSEDFPNLTRIRTASFQGRRSQGGLDLRL